MSRDCCRDSAGRTGPLVFEPSPRWVCTEVGDVTVADSKRVLLLWEEGKVLPVYLFLRDDVRAGLPQPAITRCPRLRPYGGE